MRKLKEKPDVIIKDGDRIAVEIYVVDTNQYIKLGKPSSMTFPHNMSDKTASIVYVSFARGGTNASEQDLDHEGTWEWIQKMMQKGYDAYGKEEKEKEDKL